MCWSTQKGCVVIVLLSFLATCAMSATTPSTDTGNNVDGSSTNAGSTGAAGATPSSTNTPPVTDSSTNNTSTNTSPTNTNTSQTTAPTTVDTCVNVTCENNGTCIPGPTNATCNCTDGWLGPLCQTRDYCFTSACNNNGVCISGASNYTCNCTSGWIGWLCDEVDHCLGAMCTNNATCVLGADNYTCDCQSGWTGWHCDVVDHCLGAMCTNNATCVLGADNYTCDCQSGWTGWHCDVDADDCENTPCKNDGNCTDVGTNNFTCSCSAGWTGDTCETDVKECETNPCVNGTCHEGLGNFTCVCDVDYQGTLCNEVIDDCLTNPCHNFGSCVDDIGNYICNCTAQWMGRNCTEDVDECKASPCTNGFCQNTKGNYTCYCNKGWEGQDCSVDINECMGNPCNIASEVCTNNNGSYACSCKPEYELRGKGCIETLLFDSPQGVSGNSEIYGPYFAPGRLPYFGKTYDAFYVSRDGYILLDRYRTLKNPAFNASDWPSDVVAPYWSHWDIPAEGAALYVTEYTKYQSNADKTLNRIQEVVFQKLSENITVEYALVVTWMDVIPYPADEYKGFQNVTFQAVLATDGQKTYAVFVYDQLNLADNSTLVISRGYSTQTGASVLSPVTKGTRSLEVYKMFSDSSTLPANDNYKCLDKLAEKPKPHFTSAYYRNRCPCTKKQALLDERFKYNVSEDCANLRFDPEGGTCCYDPVYGTLLANEKGAGYPRSSNKSEAIEVDRAYSICCGSNSAVCKAFYAKYPSDTCANNIDVTSGYYWGSPVTKTSAGTPYIFNGIGEYVLFGKSSRGPVIQGRFEKVADNINVTVLTAVAVQINSVTVEAILGADKSSVEFYHQGVMLQSGNMTDEFVLGRNTIIFHYGQFVQVAASGQLLVSVFVPQSDNAIFNSGLVSVMASDAVTQENVTAAKVVTEGDSKFNYSLATGNFSTISTQAITPLSYSNLTIYRDALYSSNSTTVDTANTTCGDDVACLVSYKVLSDTSAASGLMGKMEDIKQQETTLNMKPPMFSGLPRVWNVTKGDFSLVVKATNDLDATYSVMTTEDRALYSYNETSGEFTWNVTMDLSGTEKTFQFVATAGLNATYTPALAVCLCAETSQCDYNIINYSEKRISGLFSRALCRCPENTKGDYCEEVKPVCHGQCFRGATCNESRADNPCTCPVGLEGDGIRCYDKNECSDNVCGDHSLCTNLRGNYSCSCMKGYQRQDNKCVDIDECKTNSCPGYNDSARQVCENTDGGCKWYCRPTFKGRYCTSKAIYTFGGQIVFAQVPGKDQVWTSDLKDKNSDAFKNLAGKVETALKEAMKIPNATVMIIEFQLVQQTAGTRRKRQTESGEIEAKYEVGTNTPTTAAALQTNLADSFSSCPSGSSCILGSGADTLFGVNQQMTTLADEYDLCGSDTNNNCHAASTICTSGNGTFTCRCRPGFKVWPLHENACEDVNECDNMTAACGGKGTNCTNLLGTYTCSCQKGYYWTNPTDKCQSKCNEVPCKNGGSCINMPGEDPGYACRCPSGWVGPTCEEKDPEAERKRIIIIAVSASLGALCFLLLVGLCCVCRKKNPPSKASGHSFDVLDDSNDYMAETRIPRPQVRRNTDNLEMVENGSKTNLLIEEEHAFQERQASFNKHTKFEKDPSESQSYINKGYRQENGTDEDRYERL